MLGSAAGRSNTEIARQIGVSVPCVCLWRNRFLSHDISRNLIRVWVEKYEAGACDEDAKAADPIQAYEARIAALERLVGKQAPELEFQKGVLRSRASPKSAPISGIAGPDQSEPQSADTRPSRRH